MLLSMSVMMAQNTFKGIVKYDVKSAGVETIEIPAEVAVAEIKVSGDDLFTKSAIFTGQAEYVLIQGLTVTQCMDFSQLLGYLRQQGSEFTYQGEGKLVIKSVHQASEMDSLYIEDKEPGHFYYEAVESETKQIAGWTAKKLIRHSYDEEGVDHPMVMWYTDEIGPQNNILFGGIKGMPLECTVDAGENKAITYTATEIIKGKVKEADFLLPSGYDSLTEGELRTLMEELQEEIELLQAE